MTTYFRDHLKLNDHFGGILPVTFNLRAQPKMDADPKWRDFYKKYLIPDNPNEK